jgi:hypothetical protein
MLMILKEFVGMVPSEMAVQRRHIQHPQATQAVQRFGSYMTDPFQSLPVPTDVHVDSLVKYCKLSQ